MALSTTIKQIDKRPNGVLRFRRRFPKDVAEAIGEPTLQVHIKNREGVVFLQEYQAIMHEFDTMVSEVRSRIKGRNTRTPIEKWHDALLKREQLALEVADLRGAREVAAMEINKKTIGAA
ncbi:hypothetical protein [uncultured Roseobacter sp.]|uniref:hypothetical protein n=1 Tax=uncultured Roseobacter sp. TaxID=114847 RepID=UPI002606ADE0|nr:hypothetical protein [uncultured Roseobacter sp.]